MTLFRAFLLAAIASAAIAAPPAISEIGAPAGVGAAEPFLFATRDGGLLLSWLEPASNAKETALRFAIFRGGRWSEVRTIVQRGDLFVNWADFPSVIEDAKGTLFAHWLQKSAGDVYAYDVRIATSKDGGRTWSAPMLLNRDGKKGEHGFATLAPLPAGGIGATWLDGQNMVEGKEEGEMTIRYATIDGGGAMRSDVQLDARTCECCTTGMVIAGGRPVIAYRDRSPEDVRDIAVVRETAKGWTAPRLLRADGWKIDGCPVNGPQLDARGNHIVAAWFTAANEQGKVYVAFSDDAGATFGTVIAIDDGKPVGRVDVVMTDADAALVTWLEQTAGGAELRARRITRNGKQEPSFKLADSSAARGAGFARAAVVGQDSYVAWTGQTGMAKSIHVTRVRF